MLCVNFLFLYCHKVAMFVDIVVDAKANVVGGKFLFQVQHEMCCMKSKVNNKS